MSEFVEVTPELLASFQSEAPAHLDRLEQNLLAFESQNDGGAIALRSAEDHERMNEMFRAAHSLKSNSASLGFLKIRDLTHIMESLFDQFRSGKRDLHGREVEGLFGVVDTLRRLVAELAQSSDPPVSIEESRRCLEQILQQDASPRTASEPMLQSGESVPRAMAVCVAFPAGFSDAPLEACMIHNCLAGQGELLSADPDAFDWPVDAPLPEVTYYLKTAADPAAIEAALKPFTIETTSITLPTVEQPPCDQPGEPRAAAPATSAQPEAIAAVKAPGAAPSARTGETVRVDLDRLDQLMNLAGELVITKSRFLEVSRKIARLLARTNLGRQSRGPLSELSEAMRGLNRISDGIQKRIMQTRMVPIGPLFQRFRRVVRDIAKSTGKKADLELLGEATELDKRVIDELADPLTHMVRNAVDHGLEPPDERRAAGKPETGRVWLNACHRGRYICIEVRDDGRGIDVAAVRRKIVERGLAAPAQVDQMSDREVMHYVFRPGFTTARQVTDVSGRGMGMDIVKNKIESLSGVIELSSTGGHGTSITIRLPLTLAIIRAMLARVGDCVYAVPLEMVFEVITVTRAHITVQHPPMIRLRERVIPLMLLEHLLSLPDDAQRTVTADRGHLTVMIVGTQDNRLGLVVDSLLGQEEIVIKEIVTNYANVEGVSGASIMGDGSVSLILDVPALMRLATTPGKPGRNPDRPVQWHMPAAAPATPLRATVTPLSLATATAPSR